MFNITIWNGLLFNSAEEDDEEVVHMGNSIMSFYSALIDLLGRCAPEMHVRKYFLDIYVIITLRTYKTNKIYILKHLIG